MEKRHKVRVGLVISDKMQKTVVVQVETQHPHPLYRRIVRQAKKFKAHDEDNACRVGDLVRIEETRPLSKEKRWRVAQILVRGERAEVQPHEIDREVLEGAPEPEAGPAQEGS